MGGDVGAEVDRLVAWIVATIQVERGIDPKSDAAMMTRIREDARIAHAQRTRHFDIQGIEVVVSERQLDEIFSGKAKPPNVEQHRARPDARASAMNLYFVVIIFAVFATIAFGAYMTHHDRAQKPTKDEHR